jgi:GNAT superfamily N-acetyltransferase
MIDTLTITRVAVPASLEDPDAADFIALADVFNRAMEHDLGLDHLKWVASESLPGWLDQTYRVQRGYLATRDGTPVGALQISAQCEEGATTLEFDLLAVPEARGEGVERALLEQLLSDAAELGRSSLQTWSVHPLGESPTIAAPTGFGAVPLDEQSRFLLGAGFTLRQVERNSSYPLTADPEPVQRMLEEAQQHAGPDYRLVTWTSPTPTAFEESFAWVVSRMSTDVPMGGMDAVEEVWDAERIRRRDARLHAAGLTISVAAIVHEPTHRIVAYNELGIGADLSRPTSQWGTLVIREHRGHRLGTIVKCANILRWRGLVPTSPFITTFNAEENRPMLDVNEAVGFTPLTVAGAWELRV